MNRSKMEFPNFLGEVFQIMQKKLGIPENSTQFWIEATKTNILK